MPINQGLAVNAAAKPPFGAGERTWQLALETAGLRGSAYQLHGCG